MQHMTTTTCPVVSCQKQFEWEQFQTLQPGFDYKWNADEKTMTIPNDNHHDDNNNNNNVNNNVSTTALGLPEHVWSSSKALYVLDRIKALARETHHRPVKALVFSDFCEHLYRIRLEFERAHFMSFASFMSGDKMTTRLHELERFRTQAHVSVMLMSEIGAIGLDLSFVTHIFLMDEIWDKSVEAQVIARAHRMGATSAVHVEQLEMRGSMEPLVRSTYETTREHEHAQERTHSMRCNDDSVRFQHKNHQLVANKERITTSRLYHVLENVRLIEKDEGATARRSSASPVSTVVSEIIEPPFTETVNETTTVHDSVTAVETVSVGRPREDETTSPSHLHPKRRRRVQFDVAPVMHESRTRFESSCEKH